MRRAIHTSRPAFGPTSSACRSSRRARSIASTPARRGLEPVGIHVHVGSQITDVEPLRRAAERVADLAAELTRRRHRARARGHRRRTRHLVRRHARADAGRLRRGGDAGGAALGVDALIEPGRLMVGAAGMLLARLVDLKSYDGRGAIRRARRRHGGTAAPRALRRVPPDHRDRATAGRRSAYEVVGPICESGDIFGRDRLLPPLEVGDVLAILDAGAYGSVMASTYNRHMLPARGARGRGRPGA